MQALKKTKQEVVAEFRSAEILEAARRVFARKGFEGASVDEIAEAAGLAKGTVYVYFHSKRELYLAALKQGLAGLMTETGRNMDAAPTAAEKIRAFLGTRIRYAEAHRDFFALYQAEFGNIHPACLGREFKNLYQQQLQAVQTALDQGLADHEIRSVPRNAAAFMVCEMTRALIGRRLLGWSRSTADEDVDFLFNLIWNGLAAGSGRARPGDASWIVH